MKFLDILYSAKHKIELRLPMSYLIKEDIWEDFSILLSQYIHIVVFLDKEDSALISDEPFIQAKINKLVVSGADFIVCYDDDDENAITNFGIKVDKNTQFKFETTEEGAIKFSLSSLNISFPDETTAILKDLVAIKWPEHQVNLSKSLVLSGDVVSLSWSSSAYDRVVSQQFGILANSGNREWEVSKSGFYTLDFIKGEMCKRHCLYLVVEDTISISCTISVKNVLTKQFEQLKPLDENSPVYAIKQSTPIELHWKVNYADEVLFSPFGKVDKEGLKRFTLKNPLDLLIKVKLGSKTRELPIQLHCYPTKLDTTSIISLEQPNTFYADLSESKWSEALYQKRLSIIESTTKLENKISFYHQSLLEKKKEFNTQLSKLSNSLTSLARQKGPTKSKIGVEKKYDYSSILNRFSQNKGKP